MPLYKITERRLKRKERDEEDGIATLKAALREEMGGGETDDEESESDTDSDSDGEGGDEGDSDVDDNGESEDDASDGADGEAKAGPSGNAGGEYEEDEGDLNDDSPLQMDQDSSEEEEEEDPGPAPMSIYDALTSPIYLGSAVKKRRRGPFSRCVLCPGKILQSDKVIQEHLTSALHKRAGKRYATRLDASKPIETEDPRELVQSIFDDLGPSQARPSQAKKVASEATSSSNPNPKSTSTTKSKSAKSADSPSVSTSTPKNKPTKASKSARRAARAQAILDRIAERPAGESAGQPDIVEVDGRKPPPIQLNRAARRLLAEKTKNGEAGAVTEGGSGVERRGDGDDGAEEPLTKARKSKKARMGKKAGEGDDGPGEKVGTAEGVERENVSTERLGKKRKS